jgi:hypothetical protein
MIEWVTYTLRHFSTLMKKLRGWKSQTIIMILLVRYVGFQALPKLFRAVQLLGLISPTSEPTGI